MLFTARQLFSLFSSHFFQGHFVVVLFFCLVLVHRRMLPTFCTFSLGEAVGCSVVEHLLCCAGKSPPPSSQLHIVVWKSNMGGRVRDGNSRPRAGVLCYLRQDALPDPTWTWLKLFLFWFQKRMEGLQKSTYGTIAEGKKTPKSQRDREWEAATVPHLTPTGTESVRT